MKASLLDILPSQHDATFIKENTSASNLQLARPRHSPSATPNQDFFNMAALQQSSVTTIALSILYLALSIQQLRPDCGVEGLEMQDIDQKVQQCIFRVNSSVLADEDLVCSIEGVQCLLILEIIYINDAALSKAWDTSRRALSISMLLGFHKAYSKALRDSPSPELAIQRKLWLSAIKGDRYTSMILGLEPTAQRAPFGPRDDWYDSAADQNDNFQRQLCLITGDLMAHNISCKYENSTNLEVALDITRALDDLYLSMPPSWWEIPTLQTRQPSVESDIHITHIFFFTVQVFAHLPDIFTTADEEVRLHSRNAALRASRSILHYYLSLRQTDNTQLHCRVVDFSAFIPSVLILLLLIQEPAGEDSWSTRAKADDKDLVKSVMQSLEALGGTSKREVVAKQSAELLRTLLDFAQTRNSQTLQITIPYFGMFQISLNKLQSDSASVLQLADRGTVSAWADMWQTQQLKSTTEGAGSASVEAGAAIGSNTAFSIPDFAPTDTNQFDTLGIEFDSYILDSIWDANLSNEYN
jgi:hypothetical protein